MNKKAKTHSERIIALNRKASHDYFIENRFEAGLALEGWEVKSLREGRAQLKESYVIIKNGAAWLLGAHISPTKNTSTHITADPLRTRKLLLNKKELSRLSIAKERQGYTIVTLDLHWTNNRAKAQIALAKGKKTYDKRETEKRKTWERERQRLLKPKR